MLPQDPAALVEEGARLMEEGQPEAALSHFRQAVTSGHGAPEAAYLCAVALAALSRWTEAHQAIKECLLRHFGYGPALEMMDVVEAHLGGGGPRSAGPDGAAGPKSESAPSLQWAIGQVVASRWEVFGAAQGGMGQVYFVRDSAWDGMTLAVKTLLLPAGRLAQEEVAEHKARFRRETQIWLDLGAHPHIVSGFYTLEVDGALRFFMEYVPGASLARVLGGGPLPLPRALDLLIQMAAGMAYVHARGVAHRDLKPQNCLVMPDDLLRIADFGLGKALSESEATVRPMTQAAAGGLSVHGAGTPLYMAPEQWRALGQAGPPADVYAFGVVLHEVVAGSVPFSADTANLARHAGRLSPRVARIVGAPSPMPDLVLRLLHEEVAPPPLSCCGAEVPAALEDLARRCLDKDPARRPGFSALLPELHALYRACAARPYPREVPAGLGPGEAGENNRAVSYYVMGEVDKARRILDGWLHHHPGVLYPWLNRQAIALNQGEVEPAALVTDFQRVLSAVDAGRDPAALDFRERLRHHAYVHPAPLSAGALSPDGELALAVGEDGVLVMWEPGGAPRLAAEAVSSAVFCGAGLVLIGGRDGHVRLSSLGGGAPRWMEQRHSAAVTAVACDRVGSIGISGGADECAWLWDLSGGAPPRKLTAYPSKVTAAALSPDGLIAALGHADGTVALWGTACGALLRTLPAHRGRARALAFRGDSGVLASGGGDGEVRIFSREGAPLRVHVAHTGEVAALAFGPDGALLSGGADGVARLSGPGGEELRAWRAHPVAIAGVALSEGEVLTAGADGVLLRWERAPVPAAVRWPLHILRASETLLRVRAGRQRDEQLRRLDGQDPSAYAAMQALRASDPEIGKDVDLLIALNQRCAPIAVPAGVRAAAPVWRATAAAEPTSLAAAGAFVLSGHRDRVARLFRSRDGQLVHMLAGHKGVVTAVALAPDGELAVTAGGDGAVVVWDVARAAPLRSLGLSGGAVTSLSLSSGRIAAGTADGLVATWAALDTTGPAEVLGRFPGPVAAVALSPDAGLLVAAVAGVPARVFALSAGAPAWRIKDSEDVRALCFSPDGRTLASTGETGIRLWPVGGGAGALRIDGHAAAFTPEGRIMLLAEREHEAALWDVPRGHRLCTLRGHTDRVVAVAAAPEGWLYTASWDGTVRGWVADVEWCFGEEALADADRLFDGESRLWPHARGASSVDPWLDAYQDLARCVGRRGLAPQAAQHWQAVRARIIAELVGRLREAPRPFWRIGPLRRGNSELVPALYRMVLLDSGLAAAVAREVAR